MKDHELILQMIESVDPEDMAKLDEIDARVWCFLKNKTYLRHTRSDDYGDRYGIPIKTGIWISEHAETDLSRWDVPYASCDKYTRSRDALKKIRPEGWDWYMSQNGTKNISLFGCSEDSIGTNQMQSPMLPTEELAELHAIIQAIAYERATK